MKDHLAKSFSATKALGTDRVSISTIMQNGLRTRIPNSQAKVALKASSEDELLELEAIAKSLDLCARSILDA